MTMPRSTARTTHSKSKKAVGALAFLATLGVSAADTVAVGAEPRDVPSPPPIDGTFELPAAFDAYLDSPYTYWDAEALAEYWGIDEVYDAKIKLGGLLKAGIQPPLEPSNFVPPPPDLLRYFDQSEYSYDDAVELAEYWGIESTLDAKEKIGSLLKSGFPLPVEPGEPIGAFTLYNDYGYGWGDAADLANYWGIESTLDAKHKAAALLAQGEFLPIPSREIAVINYAYAGYGWGDAVELAEYWGLDHPNDAKLKAGRELKADGTLPLAPRQLALSTFHYAGHSWADAVELAEYWGIDPHDAKIKAGRELKAGSSLDVLTAPPAT